MQRDSTLSHLITALIEREGGFVDHPDDLGGPTRWGITLKTLSDWRQMPCGKMDIKYLLQAEARDIYTAMYWERPGLDRLDTLDISPVVVEMLFDTAVHCGPTRAIKLLQRAIGCKPDGHLGPITATCAARLDGPHLAALFMGERVAYLGRLIRRLPRQAVFAAGWMDRMREFIIQIPLA